MELWGSGEHFVFDGAAFTSFPHVSVSVACEDNWSFEEHELTVSGGNMPSLNPQTLMVLHRKEGTAALELRIQSLRSRDVSAGLS